MSVIWKGEVGRNGNKQKYPTRLLQKAQEISSHSIKNSGIRLNVWLALRSILGFFFHRALTAQEGLLDLLRLKTMVRPCFICISLLDLEFPRQKFQPVQSPLS